MNKYQKYGKIAETHYVEDFLSLQDIENRLDVSTRTLGKWKKKFKWEDKKIEHKKRIDSLSNKIYSIGDNILDKITAWQTDSENNPQPTKEDYYLLNRLLPLLKKTKDYENEKNEEEKEPEENKKGNIKDVTAAVREVLGLG